MHMSSNVKKLFYCLVVAGALVAYAFYQNKVAGSANVAAGTAQVLPVTAQPSAVATEPLSTVPASGTGKPPVATSTPIPTAKGRYVDGQYTGSVANEYYGNVQVQVTVSGGKITDVAFLQYPNDRARTSSVSAMAMPVLKSETISAQSANIDVVSGATDMTQAFEQSLASALSQAKS